MSGPEMSVSNSTSAPVKGATNQVAMNAGGIPIGKNNAQGSAFASNPIAFSASGNQCNKFLFESISSNGKLDGYI